MARAAALLCALLLAQALTARLESLCPAEVPSRLAVLLLVYAPWIAVVAVGAFLPWVVARRDPKRGQSALAAVAVLSLCGTILAAVGLDPAFAAVRAARLVAAFALVLGALATGLGPLDRWLPRPCIGAGERLLFAAGLGAGLLSLGTLGISCVAPAAAPLALVLALPGLRRLPAALREATAEIAAGVRTLPPAGFAAAGFALAALALWSPAAHIPPLDYDVLEYHLQLPREYLDLGRNALLPHNAFSGFPQNMEMLTLLAFTLAGGLDAAAAAQAHGVWLAQLLNFAFLPLLLLAAAALAGRVAGSFGEAGRGAAPFAAALTLAVPAVVIQSAKLYVETGMSAYTLLAALALVPALAGEGPLLRRAGLAGLFAGLAAGCKLPGLLFVGLPVCLLALAARGPLRLRLAAAVLAGMTCWLALAPWLARNAAATGNPFHPLWSRAFAVPGWSAEQEERFRLAHRPPIELSRLPVEAKRVFLGGPGAEELGAFGIALLPGLLLLPAGARRGAAGLIVWAGGAFLLWFFLTHRVERFFQPVYLLLPPLAAAGLAGLRAAVPRMAGVLGAAALACVVLFHGSILGGVFGSGWGPEGRTPLLSVCLGRAAPEAMLAAAPGATGWPLRQWMREARIPSSRVLLLGMADPFWLPRDIEYAVVFSEHPLWPLLRSCANADEVRARLRARGLTHLFVHWSELARLHGTYHRAFELTGEEQKKLRDLLGPAVEPLAPPWEWEAARERVPYFGRLVTAWPELFPAGAPAGAYARAGLEIVPLER